MLLNIEAPEAETEAEEADDKVMEVERLFENAETAARDLDEKAGKLEPKRSQSRIG